MKIRNAIKDVQVGARGTTTSEYEVTCGAGPFVCTNTTTRKSTKIVTRGLKAHYKSRNATRNIRPAGKSELVSDRA